jgi:hypothetical protein
MTNNTDQNKKIVITINENEASIYEYDGQTLLFNQLIDNDRVVSHREAQENWNEFATGRGKIVGGNEGQWKYEVDKHILKETFVALHHLFAQKSMQSFDNIVIFYSSNVAKEELGEAAKIFLRNHPSDNIKLINKNLHGHEMVKKGLEALD